MWQNSVDEIAKDNIHGASYLLQKAAAILIEHCDSQEFETIATSLMNIQPMMAPIYNLVAKALQNKTACKEVIEEFLLKESEERKALIQKGAALIMDGDSLLTHSFSSIVFDIFTLAAQEKRFQVICSESRPKLEGVEMAKRLSKFGIEVCIAIDAAIPSLLTKKSKIFFGADGIGEFGLVHKIGSYPIALAAKVADSQCFAFATSSRIWPEGFKCPKQPKKHCEEIASDISCINYYFDITPPNLFTLISP